MGLRHKFQSPADTSRRVKCLCSFLSVWATSPGYGYNFPQFWSRGLVQNNGLAQREAISCLQEQRGNTTDSSQNGEPSCVGNRSTQETCCNVYEVYACSTSIKYINLFSETPSFKNKSDGGTPAYYKLRVFKMLRIVGHVPLCDIKKKHDVSEAGSPSVIR